VTRDGDDPPAYDLLLRGGTIVDPDAHERFIGDVAVAGGQIAAVGPALDPRGATRVVELSGKILTPGLVDLHAHGYWGVTYDGLNVDAVAGRTGVTTWVDAGSSGAATFPGFRHYVIEPSTTRIVPFLNLCAIGIIYRGVLEFNDLRYADVPFAVETIEEHRDLIAGIKVRLGRAIVGDSGDQALWLARDVADHTGLPLLVHLGLPPPSIREILGALQPGDIVTHCFRGGVGGIVLGGKIRADVRAARRRGVLFDIGHGSGSFSFATAREALDDGFPPDSISTDLHQLSIRGPAHDLPTVMSKFLALGMTLEDVVRRVTINPATAIRRVDGTGTLRVGAPADLAVSVLEDGDFEFVDVTGTTVRGQQRLKNVMTFRAGREMDRTRDYGALPLFVRPRDY
jgi:dihydroorotase